MGTSTNGVLAYGYDLGGGEVDWKIEGLGEFDEWSPAWHQPIGVRRYPVDFAALEAMRVEQGWDAKLRNALAVLGVTPTQQEPCWLLLSYMG